MDDDLGGLSVHDLLETASELFEADPRRAEELLIEVVRREPTCGPALFDLGLLAKQRRDWSTSIRWFRELATLTDASSTEGDGERPEWWNIGIAATALRDWPLARLAWTRYGIELTPGDGEVTEDYGITPIRIFNDDGDSEVVWARRICPTRARIVNVPFRTSGHHYGDVILHDGAPNGERDSNGRTYDVFDELERWSSSGLRTVVVYATGFRNTDDNAAFDAYLNHADVPHENWSNVRMLCRECSEGRPSAHAHGPGAPDGVYGFGAAVERVIDVLTTWADQNPWFTFTIDDDSGAPSTA